MTTRRSQWLRWVAGAGLVIGLSASAGAQGTAPGSPGRQGRGATDPQIQGQGDTVPFETQPIQVEGWRNTRPVLRIGQDFRVASGTSVREVVVIGGNAIVEGRVDQDVVVVAGSLRLGPEARVGGNLVAVASPVTIADGATVDRDLVVVGSGLVSPASFAAGGEHVVVGTAGIATAVQAMLPWATQGLLLGRLIVPSLAWMWWFLAIVFFLKLVIGLLFERPVRASMDQLRARPLSAVLVGLLTVLLVGPAFFLLAVSVVGIVVIPFAVGALFIAGLLGKIAVARGLGASLMAEDEPGNKLAAARSFTIGFIVIAVAYMVPVIGIVTYLFVAVFGLGAATMALFAGLRRENPAKPKPPKPLPTPAPPLPPSVPTAYPVEGSPAASAFTVLPSDEPPVHSAMPGNTAVANGGVVPPPGTLLSMPKATFMVRAAAFAIDLIVVVFASLALIDIDSPRELVLLLLLYHVVFWAMKGTTLGGMVCNLRVIRTDGEPLTVGDATIRGLSSILSLVVVGLGALWILFDPDRQAWHDRFAGTYVVVVPKNYR